MNLQEGTFKNFYKALVPAVFGCTLYTPSPPPQPSVFSSSVLFKRHAETSTPGRAVGRSAQAAAWTCPPSASAAWGASREAAAWGWRVPAASRYTKTSSSPSPKPGAARWTPPRTSWEQAWRWSEELWSSPSLGSPQGLLVACPRSRNHCLSGYPARIESPTAAMVFNPRARQVATCREDEQSLWAVHSPPQPRLTRARKILPQLRRLSLPPSDYTRTQPAVQFMKGGWGRDAFIAGCLHYAGEKASHSSGDWSSAPHTVSLCR